MRNVLFCVGALAALLAGRSQGFAQDVAFDYSNVPEAFIRFDGAGNFSFSGTVPGVDFEVTTGESVAGMLGDIDGVFSIGDVVVEGVSPLGSILSAPVTGIGTFTIHDGLTPFTATVFWDRVFQFGTSGYLNVDGVINMASITYDGVNPDLLAIKYTGFAYNVITFQFVPAQSLYNLKTKQLATSFSGSVLSPAQPAGLGDFVWEDLNANGQQDTGEPGIPGVTVHLVDCAGNILNTTTTDSDGYYAFTGLTPGDYAVQFATPGGYVATASNQGNDASDSDSVNGMTQCVTLVSGETNNTLDAGFFRPASLGDFVWEDLNANGQQDAGEPGIAGVTVHLVDCAGNILASTVTDADGFYSFSGLAPGSYAVQFGTPVGYVATTPNIGSDISDSDAVGGMTHCVTLASGDTDNTLDAGFYRLAELGDFVWHDVNDNGIQDGGEPGIGGVTVNLWDEFGNVIATTTTSASGYYLFPNLTPGTYSVEFVTPTGYTPTAPDQGADDSKDSDSNPLTGKTGPYTLVSGESNLTVDAGYVAIPPPPCDPNWTFTKVALTPTVQVGGLGSYKYVVKNLSDCAAITGVVIVDDNGTPLDPNDDFTVTPPGGATIPALGTEEFIVNNVSLPFELCGPPTADGNDAAGLLYSEVLPSGNIKVTFIQSFNRNDNTYGVNSIGWKANRPHRFKDLVNSDQVTFSVRDATGKEVLRFQQDYITQTPAGYVSLGATGGDGKMIVGSATHFAAFGGSLQDNLAKPQFSGPEYKIDSPEYPNPDWEYYMIYWFEVKPSAFGGSTFGGVSVVDQHNSPPKSGADSFQPKPCNPCIVNVATATGYHDGLPLPALTANATVCSGTPQPQKASLGDRVWIDANKNGIQDAGEVGLGGVTVKLQNCAGTILATTTTGPLGEYFFTDLNAGSYRVQFVLPSGYTFSPADQGANDVVDSDANISTGVSACITLAAGEQNNTVDAGIFSKTTTPPPSGAGTGTPGYWMNHPSAWPVASITIGGKVYTRDQAIKAIKSPGKGDTTYNMFAHLVSAKLNVLIGNDSSCISATISAADAWMADYPLGSGVKASSNGWKLGEPLHGKLDDYNNGELCAPSRG